MEKKFSKQNLADEFTNKVLTAKYGDRFSDLEDVEEDKEINEEWEFLNEKFYNLLVDYSNLF